MPRSLLGDESPPPTQRRLFMKNATGILAALGFVALGLTSTSADAHVDVAFAPATVAVGGLVVSVGGPPPVVYAPSHVHYVPPPHTVVYQRSGYRHDYRAPVTYRSHRPVVVHAPAYDMRRDHRHGHHKAYNDGRGQRGPNKHHGNRGHGGRGNGVKHRR
jgi:hypothetical protein